MDSQSVKNTDSAASKGYDAGKKVSGIKRHIAVDTQGLPHAIHVTTANVTDRAGALAMFDRRRDGLSQVQNVLVDGGYTGKPFATAVQGLLGASVEVVKRSELHTFVVLPKRWVVERSFAWLEKCRRLWKNCERKLNTSLQMVVLAFYGVNPQKIVDRLLANKWLQTDCETPFYDLHIRCARVWAGIFHTVNTGAKLAGLLKRSTVSLLFFRDYRPVDQQQILSGSTYQIVRVGLVKKVAVDRD